jgi:signal peptidase I
MDIDFELVLFVVVLITGVVWTTDMFWLKKRRGSDAKDPWWVEYGGSLFPVLLVVFLFRSFLVEPFRIPSESMMPTLLNGDFILVNKYTYGVRLPILDWKIFDVNAPQRGEVMVFRFPENPGENYIKRVVGLPGDTVAYQDKRLTINGKEVEVEKHDDYQHIKLYYSTQFEETLGSTRHRILNDDVVPAYIDEFKVRNFPGRKNCQYNTAGVICEVPNGSYFVMGDNRDNSEDSRYWGFVPEENIVGKAFFIWFNFSDLGRIGVFN